MIKLLVFVRYFLGFLLWTLGLPLLKCWCARVGRGLHLATGCCSERLPMSRSFSQLDIFLDGKRIEDGISL